MGFEALGLSAALVQAVTDSGYIDPTPIQAQAIPALLQGRDLLGIAQTGTGKTAAFTLPMIDILSQGRTRARMPRSLILEPTRELAAQVAENFDKYGKYHKLTKALIIGGVGFGDQDKLLAKGVDVLIATPGRLLDQVERSKIMLMGVEVLVIDEADRMLDMGFIPDVERICAMMPGKRQTLFFSATMPGPVKKLADRFLNDPKVVEVARAASTNASILQHLVEVNSRNKKDTLRGLLKTETVQNAIIFCNRKRDVSTLHDSLKRYGINIAQLHGDMEQPERTKVLENFKNGTVQILVASDVAARGLDIPAVSHVFNYDVPIHAEDYVHRIGRTGRAGRSGSTFMFAGESDAEAVQAIEKLINQKIPLHNVNKSSADADPAVLEAKEKHATPVKNSVKPKQAEAPAKSRPAKSSKSTKPPENLADADDNVLGLGANMPAFMRVSARSALPEN